MFTRILLPLDLSAKHQVALDTAAALARQSGGEVILLHVIEEIPGLSRDEEKDFYARLERAAREHLAHHAVQLTQQQVPCRYDVVLGQRARETIAYAAGQQIDLILLTTPPFHPDNLAGSLGSLSWKISVVAPCPVLLVKGSPHPTA
jgi:nucleotide-binding universal stress UspA family protein